MLQHVAVIDNKGNRINIGNPAFAEFFKIIDNFGIGYGSEFFLLKEFSRQFFVVGVNFLFGKKVFSMELL